MGHGGWHWGFGPYGSNWCRESGARRTGSDREEEGNEAEPRVREKLEDQEGLVFLKPAMVSFGKEWSTSCPSGRLHVVSNPICPCVLVSRAFSFYPLVI